VAAISLAWNSSQAAPAIRVEHFQPAPIVIRAADLPRPFASVSAQKSPRIVPPAEHYALRVPQGFRVELFAEQPNSRWLTVTPEGDVLCVASRDEQVIAFTRDAGAVRRQVFLDKQRGCNLPMGVAVAGEWFFLGNTDAVLRFPYHRGRKLDARLGTPQVIARLPGKGYNQHWTRNVVASPDGKKLYVSVGSATNVSVEELPRAAVLEMNLDGSGQRVFAFGLRNPVGLAFQPGTGALYTTVNERDGLGDDLVPDYFTRLRPGQFYGWPYAYLSPDLLDPRRTVDGRSERPELAARTQSPDVLFQAHSAALGVTFYAGRAFPERYRGGAFVAFRGSWNRSAGTGYKLVFVPFDDRGRPKGWYEDFVTGFLLDPAGPTAWGRPVGVLELADGSLLFTEELNGRIYRVVYAGR
jgi:glucose/arabinose dehydrogenase